LKKNCFKLLANESGATAIEYGLIAAAIALAIIAIINSIGIDIAGALQSISDQLK
jgi:pilus assembly protein Flp/PilA